MTIQMDGERLVGCSGKVTIQMGDDSDGKWTFPLYRKKLFLGALRAPEFAYFHINIVKIPILRRASRAGKGDDSDE